MKESTIAYIPMPFENKAEIRLISERRTDADQQEVKITGNNRILKSKENF